jgi:PAS domain S-box-containing protein
MTGQAGVAAIEAPSGYEALLAIAPSVLEAIPAGVYLCAADGVIVRFNRRAAELWGRTPKIGDTDARFCGSFRLYNPDGSLLPHARTPMAEALRTGRPQRNKEVVIERPDGSRIIASVHIDPLPDGNGVIQGAINCFQDITDLRMAEKARQQLVSIVESSDDAIVSKDLNGIIMSWNRGAERLFGYAAEEVVGKSITIVIPHDRQDEEETILERIRRGERIDHYDTVRRRKDGSLVNISLTVSPVKDAQGRILGASKIARDITERKRAEESLSRRMEEQAALYRMTDRLHRAKSLEDVYDSALDAILRALPCQRASILLFDDSEVMRFVAWHGLSEEYRRATDGHSPWTPEARDPQPICVDDVDKADFAEPLRATIKAEGIGALAFVPLVTNGRLIGKFMAYYNAPHAFTETEVDLALAIGRQLGFGVERLRAEEARRAAEKELRESEARESARAAELRTIMEAVPAVIWIARDRDGQVITGNRASYEFLRLSPESNPSLSAPEDERPSNFIVIADGRVLAPEELPVQRAARGEEVLNWEQETRFDDGTSRYLFGNATPLRDAEGNPCGAVAAFVDITDRKKMEEQRQLLLAELSHRVKNTLATVISIAHQTFSTDRNVDEARRSFASRIRALAQTHNRLADANWSGVSLEAMLRDELAPYRREDGGNVHLSGPPVAFNAKCALTLGMTIHELATNAAKHGALSSKGGAVEVAWQVDPQDNQLRIRWRESGGPAVSPPERSGFGRLLLERALASDLGGDVQLEFAEDGLKCIIAIPLDEHVARVP